MTTHPHPLAGAVRPLEWTERYGYRIIKACAKTPLGDYHIDVSHSACEKRENVVVENACFILAGKNLDGCFYHGRFDGPDAYEAAKAAAEADYERRILSALITPTPSADVVERLHPHVIRGTDHWEMKPDPDGDYVRFEDYADLSARVAESEALYNAGTKYWNPVYEQVLNRAEAAEARVAELETAHVRRSGRSK